MGSLAPLGNEQFHVDIGALVLGWDYAAWIDMLKSLRFVQVDRGRQDVVGFEIDSSRARASRLFDGCLQQPAADPCSLMGGLDRHLGQFKFFFSQANQRAASDAAITDDREKDPAIVIQDRSLWIGQNQFLVWFDAEEAGDPFFIKPAK